MLGVINGTAEWIFAHPGRISVTVSDGGRLFDLPRPELAAQIWRDVAAASGCPPRCRRSRSCASAAPLLPPPPEQNALRPGATTDYGNLFLAGDWTDTGLPATLESAVRSGYRAADLVAQSLRAAA